MTDVNTWLANIDRVRTNPAAIQEIALNRLDEITKGLIDVVDASNPFAFLLEAGSVNAAAAMLANETLTRKQYPSVAVTEDDLYLHMSDRDYVGRFATPSRGVFKILMSKDELVRQRAVLTGEGRVRKLTIPRDTQITVAGNAFTMQYPIDIRVMSHGGIQVVYDTSIMSPLQTLETNIVTSTTVNINGDEYLLIDVPM